MSNFDNLIQPYITRQTQLTELLRKRTELDKQSIAFISKLSSGQELETEHFFIWMKAQGLWCMDLSDCLLEMSADIQRIVADYHRLATLEILNS